MSSKFTGLDIGTYSIKISQVVSTFKGAELVDFYQKKLPTDNNIDFFDKLQESLKELFSSKIIKDRDLVISTGSGWLATRILTFPFKDAKKISKVIKMEMEDHLPFDIDKVMVDFELIKRGKNDSTILAEAIDKEHIDKILEILSNFNIKPLAIIPDPIALFILFKSMNHFDSSNTILLDIGALKSSLIVINENLLSFMRIIPFGGKLITKSIADNFSLPFEEAEQRKIEDGIIFNDKKDRNEKSLSDVIKEAFLPLFRQLRMTLSFLVTEKGIKIERIFLTGGTSKIKNLEKYMEEEFSIPVNKLRLKESRFIKNKRKPLPEESLAVSIGLALKGLKGTKWVRTNFYQKETGLKSFLTEFKKELIITFILLFLVIISVSMTFVIKYRSKEMKIRYLNNEIKKVFKECLPGSTRVVEPVAQLKAKIKDIKKELKLFGSIGERNFTVLEILASISDNIPHDMDITIEDLNIDHEKVRLSGKADSFETVDEMKKLLANIKIFSSIKVDSLKLSADSKAVDFRITLFLIEKEKS